MPISTAQDVVNEVQAHYRGVDATTALDMVHITMDELCRDFPIVLDKFSLVLTPGVSEYNIASGAPFYHYQATGTTSSTSMVRIESAYYKRDAGSGYELRPTTEQELDDTIDGWRYDPASEPTHIYVTQNTTGGMRLGLYPAPDVATSPSNGTGVPRVDCVIRERYGASFTGSTPIPNAITNPMVLVYGALLKVLARETNGISAYGDLYSLAKSEYGKLYDELARRHRSHKVQMSGGQKAPRLV